MESAREMRRELSVRLEMCRQGRERGLGVSPAAAASSSSSQWKAHDELGVEPEAGSEWATGSRSWAGSTAKAWDERAAAVLEVIRR